MKTFIEYLKDTDRMDEGLASWFKGRQHLQEPKPPVDPVAAYQAMSKKALSGFKPDKDQPRDDDEARVMQSMNDRNGGQRFAKKFAKKN